MPNIVHSVGLTGITPAQAFQAFATVAGLKSWWTRHSSGDPAVGGTLKFGFPQHELDFKVLEAEPGKSVRWRCTTGPDDWMGTEIRVALEQGEGETKVYFKHAGWREETKFMSHCSSQWAYFLIAMKRHFEAGADMAYGAPGYETLGTASPKNVQAA